MSSLSDVTTRHPWLHVVNSVTKMEDISSARSVIRAPCFADLTQLADKIGRIDERIVSIIINSHDDKQLQLY